MNRVAVVGGGLSGLEFALQAARNGIASTIFEAGSAKRQHHVHFDPQEYEGDAKSRSWQHDGQWAADAGIALRLGGRSLCYHGVMLPLETTALQDWPLVWQQRLQGEQGLYQQVQHALMSDYPELSPVGACHRLLQHVPQAAAVTAEGKFYAYSPLSYIAPYLANGMILIERRQISRVEATPAGLHLYDTAQQRVHASGFKHCVLAASAIVNSQIISHSLQSDISTQVTDHFCIGIMLCLPPGEPMASYRHQMLWNGYAAQHDLNANFFVQERPANKAGLRIITLMAVVEQHPAQAGFSVLKHYYEGQQVFSDIETMISAHDQQQLLAVEQRLVSFAQELFGFELSELKESRASYLAGCGKAGRWDSRWLDFTEVANQLQHCVVPNQYGRFSFPYGGFEHESCTHPMAGNQLTGLSAELQLQALPGVFAVGPGAFPRLGIANPALTICALSRWLAEHLQELEYGN